MKSRSAMLRSGAWLLAFSIVGCGPSTGTASPSPAGGGTAPAAPSPSPAGATAGGGETGTPAAGPVKLSFHRFFGECADDYGDETDPAKGEGECGIIQVLTNKWNAEHPEAQIETTVVEHDQHYQRLTAGIAAGEPPDVVIMHGRLLPNFASRGLLIPLDEEFAAADIDADDFLPTAREHASWDGKLYALPFDLQTILWYINVDLWREAGLVDGAGKPRIPKSREEFLAAAKQMKDRTGKQFVTAQMDGFIGTHWTTDALVWQQGGELFSEVEEEGKKVLKANVDTPEMTKAVSFMTELFQNGYAPNNADYGAAEAGFLQGEVASLINGTWAVGIYDPQVKNGEAAFKEMYVAPFPTIFGKPAAWSDSHTWAIPSRSQPDPAKIKAAVQFLKFLNDNQKEWVRTGHLPVRRSVLESSEFAALPHRGEYREAANVLRTEPRIRQIEAFRTIMNEELVAIYLGQKPLEQGLADAQSRVDEALTLGGF